MLCFLPQECLQLEIHQYCGLKLPQQDVLLFQLRLATFFLVALIASGALGKSLTGKLSLHREIETYEIKIIMILLPSY